MDSCNTRAALEAFTDQPIVGWLSPGRIQSANTPELLVKNGFRYQCDWVNDELPYTFRTGEGEMTCLPSSLELDDVFVLTQNLHSEDSFAQQVMDAADLLIKEGREQGGTIAIAELSSLAGGPAAPHPHGPRDPSGAAGRAWRCHLARVAQPDYRSRAGVIVRSPWSHQRRRQRRW